MICGARWGGGGGGGGEFCSCDITQTLDMGEWFVVPDGVCEFSWYITQILDMGE